METADLVVINTCAIREGAEQKVIGRQGHLARLKAANPAMRVVLTGCAVREAERAGLRRRYPAVDLFLRPDEEPELVDRLGLASAQGAIGHGRGDDDGRAQRSSASRTGCRRRGRVPSGRGPSRAARRSARGCRSSTAATRRAPTASCPFSRGPERSRPFDDIVDEARALAAAGYREVTLLGQNVNSYGHDLPPEPRFAHVDAERWAGRRLDLHGRPDLAELIRAIDGLRTADGRPAIPRLRFVTSHPVGPVRPPHRGPRRLSERLRAPPPAGPVGRRRRPAADGSPVLDRALSRATRPDPRCGARHHRLDRRHRRVLRRDRGAVPAHPGAARGGPLRPGLRRGVLAATRDAGDTPRRRRPARRQAAPAQRPARRPGDGSASPGTRRGSVGRSTSWWTRSRRHGHTITTHPMGQRRWPAATTGATSRCPAGPAATSSSTSSGDPRTVGAEVVVRIEHAGPYALRGALVDRPTTGGPLTSARDAPLPWPLPEEFPARTVRQDGGASHHGSVTWSRRISTMDYSRLDPVRRSVSPVQLDLVEAYAQGKITRRQFIQRATVIGLSLPTVSLIIAACSSPAVVDPAERERPGGKRVGGRQRQRQRGCDRRDDPMRDPATGLRRPDHHAGPRRLRHRGPVVRVPVRPEHRPERSGRSRRRRSRPSGRPTTTGRSGRSSSTRTRSGRRTARRSPPRMSSPRWSDSSRRATPASRACSTPGGAVATDDATVTMTLASANGNFPYLVSIYNAQTVITPADVRDRHDRRCGSERHRCLEARPTTTSRPARRSSGTRTGGAARRRSTARSSSSSTRPGR